MLYYYAEKSRLCLLRHSTIIFHLPAFVKGRRRTLVILPRYSLLYRGFFDTRIKERMFTRKKRSQAIPIVLRKHLCKTKTYMLRLLFTE